MSENYQLGVTKSFPCNYLPDEEERLLVATDLRLQNSERYTWLMTQGFRRSGDQIYRPHCINCSECQSIRVLVDQFTASRSQKRLLKKNSEFTCYISKKNKADYYPLYEEYINKIHRDGSMYPADKSQFASFLTSKLTDQIFIELWHNEKLISVAVTDLLSNAFSAVYTFYSPEYRPSALGVFSILKQIEIAKSFKKEFLYLGYQIDGCTKMNYKDRYFPFEKLKNNIWVYNKNK
ncbi:MAG: arginyltransferase [Alteromonadaceae bacterium]|nr:arginyltransferase [Alteromonadaceae bacterium]